MRGLVLLGALAFAGCTPSVPPEVPPPDDCARACMHARRLGCSEGEPTAGEASCEDVCRKAASLGIDTGVACVQAALSCDEIARCEAR